jgi:hypothetical protein
MQALFEHIHEQTAVAVDRLYGSGDTERRTAPWSCKAMFQALRPLSKAILMRLIFFEDKVEYGVLLGWMLLPTGMHEFEKSMEELKQLRMLLVEDAAVVEQSQVSMNIYFRESLRYALNNLETPWLINSATVPNTEDETAPSIEELDEFSASSWEKVLYFLLSADMETSVPDSVKNFMLETGIMQRSAESRGQVYLTAKGYDYMLKDFHSQVCTICAVYSVYYFTSFSIYIL